MLHYLCVLCTLSRTHFLLFPGTHMYYIFLTLSNQSRTGSRRLLYILFFLLLRSVLNRLGRGHSVLLLIIPIAIRIPISIRIPIAIRIPIPIPIESQSQSQSNRNPNQIPKRIPIPIETQSQSQLESQSNPKQIPIPIESQTNPQPNQIAIKSQSQRNLLRIQILQTGSDPIESFLGLNLRIFRILNLPTLNTSLRAPLTMDTIVTKIQKLGTIPTGIYESDSA